MGLLLTYEAIIRSIEATMHERRIKQKELASAAGIHENAIGRMFKLERNPRDGRYRQEMTIPEFMAFCKRLDVDPCIFIRPEQDVGHIPSDLAGIIDNIKRRPIKEQSLILDRVKQMLADHDKLKEIAKGEKADSEAEIPFTPHEG